MSSLRVVRCLLLALACLCALGAAPAAAAPSWNVDLHHNETHFPPGGTAEYWVDVANLGDSASAGPITLTVGLPTGITRESVGFETNGQPTGFSWSCPGSPGASTLICTSSGALPRRTLSSGLIISVNVAPGASGERFATATVSGGGAAAPASTFERTRISAAPAPFGIVDGSFAADFYEADGLTPVRQAGSHPELATFAFDINSVATPVSADPRRKSAAGAIRNLRVELPPGFVGYPTAVGECSPAELSFGTCPRSSQVGRVTATIYPATSNHFWTVNTGVYNMSHPRGTIADLAFQYAGVPLHIKASLDPANNYAVRTTVSDVNETLPPLHSKVTIWGVPAAASHDSERCGGERIETDSECPTDQPKKPFLTVPAECGVERQMRLSRYDSWQHTGVFGPDIAYTMPGAFEGCEKPRFEPEISLRPTGTQANTPTGLDVTVRVPQNANPAALDTPPLKRATVTLPEGMAVNPAFADGLVGCSQSQIGLGTNNAVACPDNSRIGEVELQTPVLPGPIEGSLYLAKQDDNPFGSLLALYMALHDTEERGILVKVAGRIDLDPVTGQIKTSFDELPQFPFEQITLNFRSGPRAPLVNPPACGTHAIAATMSSYARPDELDVSGTYELVEGPEGGPCAPNPAARPFAPELTAGATSPIAGAFSPLLLQVERSDADQELSSVKGTVPAGLTASLAGVGRCSEAQIAQAAARSEPGQGAEEIASPSCPSSSQVGTVDTGAGAGPSPIYVGGKIYLAGPYKGAPLSGVAIVPAVAGPVDLGVVVVRAPAYVDSRTAQVRIESDPLPQVVNGVLIRVRDVRIRLDRPNFMLNPTNCEEKSIDAELASTEGKVSMLANRFQVGDCGALRFKPRLGLRLFGAAGRGGHPALRGVFSPRTGDANLAGLVLRLPRSAFLDQAHIRTICTRVQFAADACPEGAVYGRVKAWTPLLDEPLQGPVYLRSSNHKLPDFVADLRGEIDVEAVARIDSVRGGIRATFTGVPDAPLSRVVVAMQGGRKGLIVNSRNLCRSVNRARVRLAAHNGRGATLRPKLRSSACKKRKAKRRAKRSAHRPGGRSTR